MTAPVGNPFALLPVVVVVGVFGTIGVWVLALAWLVVLAAVAFGVVVALAWGLAAGIRALARPLTWHRAQRPAAANPRDS